MYDKFKRNTGELLLPPYFFTLSDSHTNNRLNEGKDLLKDSADTQRHAD